MLLNLAGEGEKRRLLAIQNNRLKRFGRIFQSAVRREIRRAHNEAAEGYTLAGDAGMQMAIEDHGARVGRLLRRHHEATFSSFGDREMNEIEGAKGDLDDRAVKVYNHILHGREVRFIKAAEDAFLALQEGWIAQFAGQKIDAITETTRQAVAGAILKGREDGANEAGIGALIRQTGAVQDRARSVTIARTETHNAAIAAQRSGVEALRRDYRKEWVSALAGERTRQWHADADGQIVARDAKFTVRGEKMDQPGDPSASAANVINCLCGVGFLLR